MEIHLLESPQSDEFLPPQPPTSPSLPDSIAKDEDPEPNTGDLTLSSPVRPWASSSYSRYAIAEPRSLEEDATIPDWPQWSNDDSSQLPLPADQASVGAGLSNLGNTCFLNSVLQCLTHTVGLVQSLSSYTHRFPCECGDDRFCMFCALREHVELSLASTGRVVSPFKFVDNLRYISSSFQRFQQEDAHEFLQCFLDRLDGSCNNLITKNIALSSQDDNLVKQVFGGRLVSKLRCCNCDHSSDTYEPSIDLSLEIEDADTLSNALESFTKVEKIEDCDTKFTCDKCKKEVSIEKQLMLEQAPVVSALHLKRFKNDGSDVEKIDKHVEFPLELDLKPYTSGSQDSVELKYYLYAVVVHSAWTSTCGHYYCFIRSAPDTWYKFDDSKVISVSEADVLSQEAYILFYAKQGTPWFSSFMETYKPSLDLHISNASPKSVLDIVDSSILSHNVASDCCTDVNETSEVAEAIPAESFSQLKPDSIDIAEDKVDYHKKHISLPTAMGNSKVEKVWPSAPSLKKYYFNQEPVNVSNDCVTPQTPPRSPSPDIYKDEPSPEVVFSTKQLDVKSVDRVSCKRPLKHGLEDPKIKEAFKQCKKMHGSRGAMLFQAATKGSQSEGSLMKKSKKRIAPTPNRDYSNSSDRHKRNNNPLSRPVAAASLR